MKYLDDLHLKASFQPDVCTLGTALDSLKHVWTSVSRKNNRLLSIVFPLVLTSQQRPSKLISIPSVFECVNSGTIQRGLDTVRECFHTRTLLAPSLTPLAVKHTPEGRIPLQSVTLQEAPAYVGLLASMWGNVSWQRISAVRRGRELRAYVISILHRLAREFCLCACVYFTWLGIQHR